VWQAILPAGGLSGRLLHHARGRYNNWGMDISKISIGQNPPDDIHVIIEIPQGGHPVKYEMDKKSGAMFVDRFLHTSMIYPGNYGFIPHTLSADGDPIDVLVVGQSPVIPGAIIRSRPVGVLLMEDENGLDEKILAVPVDALYPFYSKVQSNLDLPDILCEQIAHFFKHYKDLEKGKWVKNLQWAGPEEARQAIVAAIRRHDEGES
jgi:inorganic pyrophosphatase